MHSVFSKGKVLVGWEKTECGDEMRLSTDSHDVSEGLGVGNHRCTKGWNSGEALRFLFRG